MTYEIVFQQIGDLFQPIVVGETERSLPLLLEEEILQKVLDHMSKVPDRDYPYDLYCNMVAGACSMAMKWDVNLTEAGKE